MHIWRHSVCVCVNPSQSCGASPAIWDHTVFVTWHRRTHPYLNSSQAGRYSIYLPRRDGRLSWPWCWLYTEMVHLSTVSHPSRYCLADYWTVHQPAKDWIVLTQLLRISAAVITSLSLSHSRSGGRVTATMRSRKSQRRRGSVLNCPPGQMSLLAWSWAEQWRMEDQVLCRLVSAVAVWTGGGVPAPDPVKIACQQRRMASA